MRLLGLLALCVGTVLTTPETVLWFQQPGTVLNDSLMVGNGRLGASVWGGVTLDNIALNEDTIWSGGPYNPSRGASAYSALQTARNQINAGDFADAESNIDANILGNPSSQTNFQTAGALQISTSHSSFTNYRRQLDTATGLVTTTYTYNGHVYTREVFSSAPDQVIVVHLTSTGSGQLSFTASFTTPENVTSSTNSATQVVVTAKNSPEDVRASVMTFEKRMDVYLTGGSSVAASNNGVTVTGATNATLIIGITTSFNNYNDGSGASPSARMGAYFATLPTTDYTTLKSRHLASYTAMFNRFSIDLGNNPALSALPTDQRVAKNFSTVDPGLISLFVNFGRSLLIGSSQPGAVQPANLQGIWQDSLTAWWQSKFTTNINLEMNYWLAEVCNLPDVVEPLTRLLEDVAVTGRQTAQQLWGVSSTPQSSGLPAWVLHHNTDQWRATWPIDGAQYGMWPTGGAWQLQTLWEHFAFNPSNITFAERIYPLFAGASDFFLQTLQPYANNTEWLVTIPTMSPEKPHPGGTVCAGTTLDNSLLRDLFDQTVQLAQLLGKDSSFVTKIQAARAKLAPFLIGSAGQLQEWLPDWDSTPSPFSHISPLYGVFPGAQIDPRTAANYSNAAAVLLGFRGPGAQGWPIAWRIGVWARLLNPSQALTEVGLLLSDLGVYRGLLGKNQVYQIDANFGGTAGIMEMFLQSQNGEIKLLPALPLQLPSGTIKGMRARGGYSVDLTWSGSTLSSAVFTASIDNAKTMNVRLQNGSTLISLQLAKGASRTLTASSFSGN